MKDESLQLQAERRQQIYACNSDNKN